MNRLVNTFTVAMILVGLALVILFGGTAFGKEPTQATCPEDAVVVRVVAEWNGDRQARREGYSPFTVGGLYCAPIDGGELTEVK